MDAAVTVLYLVRPWRTCPDDAAAGRAMLTGDAVVTSAAMAAALLGEPLIVDGVRW